MIDKLKYFIDLFDKYYNPEINNIDEVIGIMKGNNASLIECVMMMRLKLKLSQKDADTIVLNSEAWKDDKDEILKFRNIIEDKFSNFILKNKKNKD